MGMIKCQMNGCNEDAKLCHIEYPSNDTSNYNTWLCESHYARFIKTVKAIMEYALPTKEQYMELHKNDH
jgi:hypothetical protein